MSSINETIAEVLRLDARATPGPWDEDGIYVGLRHLGKHCSDWYYRDSDGNLIEVPRERDAALVAYYRTAAPALAREVQRLQEQVRQAQTGHDCALAAAYESAHRAGQEAMRAQVTRWLLQRGDTVWADAIRALEVEHD